MYLKSSRSYYIKNSDVPLSLASQARLSVRKAFTTKLHLIPELGNSNFNIIFLFQLNNDHV